jgi:hypothetical protein
LKAANFVKPVFFYFIGFRFRGLRNQAPFKLWGATAFIAQGQIVQPHPVEVRAVLFGRDVHLVHDVRLDDQSGE